MTGPPTICKCGSAKSYHRPSDRRDHKYEPRYEPLAWQNGYERGLAEGEKMAYALEQVRIVSMGLRRLSKRTKTIYGGSDFAPVDYQVPNFSPSELTRLVDELDTALENA